MHFSREDINKIRKGYYSALYFNRTKTILLREKNFKNVTMQIFQKNNNSILCGVDEVLELLKVGTGYWENDKWIDKYKELEIEHLNDGDSIFSWGSVIHISGPYVFFAHLESLYLGILARRTMIASNSKKVVEAANGKQIIFFGDRFDHFKNQEGDGYAAHIGGINTVCTEAQAHRWNGKVSKALKQQLWGVRIDTTENLIDNSLSGRTGKEYSGVNRTLVKLLRKTLDLNKFNYVKIIVSGGFNEEKITDFEKKKTPVDVYGVGSALLKGNNDFTADIVKVERTNLAKYGRQYKKI